MALRRGVARRAWAEDEEGGEEEGEEAFFAEAGEGLGVAWLVSWLGRRGAAGEDGGREEPLPIFALLLSPRLLRRGGLRVEEGAEASSSMMTLEGEARFSLSSNEARRREARLPPPPAPSNPSATLLAAARSLITWVASESPSSLPSSPSFLR